MRMKVDCSVVTGGSGGRSLGVPCSAAFPSPTRHVAEHACLLGIANKILDESLRDSTSNWLQLFARLKAS